MITDTAKGDGLVFQTRLAAETGNRKQIGIYK
jgi:hypothetical protein